MASERNRVSVHFSLHLFTLGLFLVLGFILQNVLLETSVALSDDTLDGGELARLLLDSHPRAERRIVTRDEVVFNMEKDLLHLPY